MYGILMIMIRLERVNEKNWRTRLNVTEEQSSYVASNMVLLARAYAYQSMRSKAFIIYEGENAIGMSLYYDCHERESYDFNQFFIDKRYQGKGYGKTAAKMVLDFMRADGKYKKVVLCYIEGNDIAKRFYEKIGFKEVERDEDEIIMELIL